MLKQKGDAYNAESLRSEVAWPQGGHGLAGVASRRLFRLYLAARRRDMLSFITTTRRITGNGMISLTGLAMPTYNLNEMIDDG